MEMLQAEYLEYREQYAGYCSYCNAVTQEEGVEPDARKYTCPECGNSTLMGIEEALIEGKLEIT